MVATIFPSIPSCPLVVQEREGRKERMVDFRNKDSVRVELRIRRVERVKVSTKDRKKDRN